MIVTRREVIKNYLSQTKMTTPRAYSYLKKHSLIELIYLGQCSDFIETSQLVFSEIWFLFDGNIALKWTNLVFSQPAFTWCGSVVFIVNFEHISHLVLVFLLLTLNIQLPAGLAAEF